MKNLLISIFIFVAMSQFASAQGIAETTKPKPKEATKCAGISTVTAGSLKVPEFTFANEIVLRNLLPAPDILIQGGGVRIPDSGTRVEIREGTSLVWIKFAQVSAGNVHIIAFIDNLYTQIAPGGVDGRTYLITGDLVTGFTLQSDINESRITELCFVPMQ